MIKDLPKNWWLPSLGKPWVASPTPPESFTCGELVRYLYKTLCGIDTPAIPINNAASHLQCVRAMLPHVFSLEPIPDRIAPKQLDVAFLGSELHFHHCGIAVNTSEGLRIMHCIESPCGVVVDSLYELRMAGFPRVKWFRHPETDAALAAHGWKR